MWRTIYIQLWNRRRGNQWLLLELLLVFCLVWYTVDYFFVLGYNYNIPCYRNTDRTWLVTIGQFQEGQSGFQSEDAAPEIVAANYERILQRIKTYPGVEAMAVSFFDCTPGSGSYSSDGFSNLQDTALIVYAQTITVDSGSDFFSVFGYTQNEGKIPVKMSDFNWNGPEDIVISRSLEKALYGNSSAIGQTIGYPQNPEHRFRVVGVVDDIKRFNYQRPQHTCYKNLRPDATNIEYSDISIRITSGINEQKFITEFKKKMENDVRTGNFYLVKVNSFQKIMAETDRGFGFTGQVHGKIYLMTFFLLNVVLCIIGTFWYRVHVRRNEIGLRMALGSTRKGIESLFYREILAMLFLVVIPALIIEYQFVNAGLIETLGKQNEDITYLPDRIWLRFIITNVLTLMLISIVLLIAVWLPARKSSSMGPSEALHYE